MKIVVFASHVTRIDGKEYDGIGNTLKKTLATVTGQYTFVRNSMDGLLGSEVQYFDGAKIITSTKPGVVSRPAPVRYLWEYFKTVQYFSKQPHIDAYIGIDPLNALAAIKLRKMGKVSKAIFFTADYSPKRFKNSILNFMYHSIDRYCVKHADEVWSVSARICEIRREMGLAEEKNIFVPNVPPVEYKKYANHTHDPYQLVVTGIIDKQLDYEGAIRAVAELKHKYPQISLTIIGNGPEEKSLQKLANQLGVKDRVKFTGRVPLEKALDLQSRAGIGLALYTGIWGFNQYGDSTKCREYFSFGLPVISTDTHATVEEVRSSGAGIIVGLSVDEYKKAIIKILDNYGAYSQASSRQGDVYAGVHRKEIARILNIKVKQ